MNRVLALRGRKSPWSSPNPKHLQHLIPVVVDYLHGDLAGVGPVKGAALGGVQFRPSRFIHLGLERPLQLLIRLVAAREIGVADEEALTVVIGVDEPAGDVGGGKVAGDRVSFVCLVLDSTG